MDRLLEALLFTVFAVVLMRTPIQRPRWKKPAKAQTFEGIKRHRDSLLVVFIVMIWTEGYLWQPADLFSSLGSWAGPVFDVGLLILLALTWLIFYFLDRRKSAKQALDTNGAEA